MAKRIEIESTAFEGIGPKGLGKWETDVSTLPASIIYALVSHGIKRKIRDLSVNFHLKSEYVGFGGKRVQAEADEVFENPSAMAETYKSEVQKLFAAWAVGNFGFEGTRSANPVRVEMWSILFKRGGVASKDQSKARALTQQGLAELLVQAKAKGKKFSPAEMKKEVEAYMAALQTTAEAIVAMRSGADDENASIAESLSLS